MALKLSARHIAEQMLREYPKIEERIRLRRMEKMYPVTEPDDNVGGGKSHNISKPQERLIITLEDDMFLTSLREEQVAVAEALDNCDEVTLSIVDEYFWRSKRTKTMDGIAMEVHLTKRAIYKRLNCLYEDILRNRGLYDFLND